MKPTLSIVIVNYNTGELLARCLSSIRKNRPSFVYEVIVVDNASTDESIKDIKSTKGIKSIENKTNVGFARAVNQGIKLAKSRYILLLNPDTEVKRRALAKMVEFAQKTEDAGVVGAKLLNPDGSIQPAVFRFPTLWRAFQEFWLGKRVYSKYAPPGSGPVEVDAVVGAAFLVTPQALERVGFLDERYFMFFEDLDYCRRVKKAGLKVYYLPGAHVVHHHGVSGQGLASEESQWRRLIPSSKIYHGTLRHSLLTLIIWSGQKWQRILKKS